MNTLFKKGYLLAGVIIAANIFVVNEMKATEPTTNNGGKTSGALMKDRTITASEKELLKANLDPNYFKCKKGKISGPRSFFNFLLSYENTINLIGGAISSVANNYLKLWDYNPGGYLNLRIGCLGWRSKKLFDIVQLDFNLNLIRGISWVILGTYNFIKGIEKEDCLEPLYVSCLVGKRVRSYIGSGFLAIIALIAVFLFQGLVSVPLAIHISNFSISISLDSIIWMGIGFFLGKGKQGEQGEKKEEEEKLETNNLETK